MRILLAAAVASGVVGALACVEARELGARWRIGATDVPWER
jgi:hypothetical protein